jgi:hypothetical protein
MEKRSKAAINKDRKYLNKSQKHETSTASARKTKAKTYKKKK